MKQYELIVFDWDGTLMDSTGHIINCMQQAIKQLILPPLADSAISHIIGLGLVEAALELYPDANEKTIEQLASTYKQIWLNSSFDPILFDNAFPLIKKLNEEEYFLAVATGKSRRGLDKVLQSTALSHFFHATRCADECHSKPHPQMLEELIAYCGVDPKATLMIGDTEYDLQMAHNAGADSLAVSHGAHSTKLLKACRPLDIVDNLFQAQQWLDTNI
jgi:phosphoglycolate phosphatase